MTVSGKLMNMHKTRRLQVFWQRLSAAQEAALLLDYDGTLAPFRVNRDKALPYAGIRSILTAIRRHTVTRLVIISGRAIDDLLPLLGLEPPPEIWGCHGWEKLDANGRRAPVALPAEAASGLREADRLLGQAGLVDFIERKPASVALHWRGLPQAQVAALRSRVTACWQPIAERTMLEVHPFDGGLELRCPGRSKATAVKTILAEIDKDAPIAFLGDDLTDEDGFAALAGKGLGVLVRSEARPTHAAMLLRPPQELIAFLSAWRDHAPARVFSKGRELP